MDMPGRRNSLRELLIREIHEKDNAAVEQVIRSCLKEYGADHEGTAWCDPDLGRFSKIYQAEGTRYWVAEDACGRIAGGTGIGILPEVEKTCELQKMYLLPEYRGTGTAHRLLETALSFAGKYYDFCYLETLENMKEAQRFYEKHGFCRIDEKLGDTGHFDCDVRYRKDLRSFRKEDRESG